jgi:hypothetical protein
MDKPGMKRKSDGKAQYIRNGCSVNGALCANLTRIYYRKLHGVITLAAYHAQLITFL